MKFVIVDPKARSIITAAHNNLRDALIEAGLKPGHVDHGSLSRRIGYVVYEYGLYVPPEEQHYCGIAGHLIAGACVLYGVDDAGNTVDLTKSMLICPDVRFYRGINDVEAAIARGEIKRPIIRINDDAPLWQWPDTPPAGAMR